MTALNILRSRIVTKESATSWTLIAQERPVHEWYELLKAYYLNNGLYDELYTMLYAIDGHEESMRPLRNPAHRVVEFYAAHLWPGNLHDALQIETENKRIVEPIKQILKWSNWGIRKQRLARWLAIYGDSLIKVVSAPEKTPPQVFLQCIEATYVTLLMTDERGFLTYVRIDVPKTERNDKGDTEIVWYTEEWVKADQSYRLWKHNKGPGATITSLGQSQAEKKFAEFGIDYIPIVHIPFRDIGEERGLGSFAHSIDKIDEANRMCTRLHRLLWRYKNPVWALRANQVDPSGRPIPAPRIDQNTENEVELGGDKLLRLPGNSDLTPLIPNLSWEDALSVLQDHMRELEQDMPELAWWRLRDKAEVSGEAVQLLLGDAVQRAEEVRGNAYGGLERALQMALSIGSEMDLWSVGSYEDDDLEHRLIGRPVVPQSQNDMGEMAARYKQAGFPMMAIARKVYQTKAELEQFEKDLEDDAQRKAEEFALMARETEREFNKGGDDAAGNNTGDRGKVPGDNRAAGPQPSPGGREGAPSQPGNS
ncbi:MAG: hypothetical protein ABIH46_08380 [Chloroflexota bacterium]